jgi:hypothetical protein
MNPPIVTRTSKVVYNSLKHPVTGLSPNWHHGITHPGADTPPSAHTKPQAGAIHSAGVFMTELRGSANTGGLKVPPDAVLFKAIALKETLVGGGPPATGTTSATYAWTGDINLTPGDLVPVSFGGIYHGNAEKENCTSAVGNLQLRLEPNSSAICAWSWAGIYAAASEAASTDALETAAYGPVCKALTISVGGITSRIKRMVFDFNNTDNAPNLDLGGVAGVQAPVLTYSYPTCTVEIEQPAYSVYNAETNWTAGTKNAISAVLGSVAGNIFTITMDGYLAGFPEAADQAGVRGRGLVFAQATGSGDTLWNMVCT